jgi:tight adherence protein B
VNILLILVGVLAFVAMAGVGLVLAGSSAGNQRAAKRTQAIVSQRGRSEKSSRVAARNTHVDATTRRKQIVRSLKDNEKRQMAARFSITNRLRQAGLNFSVLQFWIGSGVFGLLAMLCALVMHEPILLSLLIAFVMAMGLPFWILGVMAQRRRAKFVAAFADAIDIIVRGIRAGLPLHDCLKLIGNECTEPLAGEFRRLVENIGMGLDLDQALEKAYERMPTPELRFFVIVLNIQQKAGGNLGEALGNLSAVIRGRRMMREKVKALSGEAVASAWIIGSLPPIVTLLIQLTSPHYLSVMFTDPRGHMMLGVAALLMIAGVLVMRKMINFKI